MNDDSVPDWMRLDDTSADMSHAEIRAVIRNGEQFDLEVLFEDILERTAQGVSLAAILRNDYREPCHKKVIRWIHADPGRQARYHEAQRIGCEVMAGEMLEIADAVDSLEDIQRSRLRIDTRQWLMKSWARNRYGNKAEVEHKASSLEDLIKDSLKPRTENE